MAPKKQTVDVEKNIKKKLIAKRKDIKNKLKQLKHGQSEHESLFHPITKHLQIIENKLEPTSSQAQLDADLLNQAQKSEQIEEDKQVKQESKNLEDEYNYNINMFDNYNTDNEEEEDKASIDSEPLASTSESTPKGILSNQTPISEPRLRKRKLSYSGVSEPINLRKLIFKGIRDDLQQEDRQKQKEYEDKLNKTIKEKSFSDYYEQYDPLPLKYIKKFIKDPNSDKSDGKFRVKFDKEIEMFSIGNKRIDFDGPDILVAGKKYKGTRGLYGLLFNQNAPSVYTKDDAKNYAQILFRTNAVKKHFNPNLDYVTSKNLKFKKLIEPLMSQQATTSETEDEEEEEKTGHGLLMQVTNNPIDYRYWDDPDELVERLKLLLASQTAGNTGHTNEIVSIIEELREANIIE